jgi:hypothetical protein
MSDLIEVLYRLRDMAGMAADKLRVEVQAGQAVLDKLDQFANECEEGAELLAASDLHPGMHANIPERSGLQRIEPKPAPIPCRYCADSPCTCPVVAGDDDTVGARHQARYGCRQYVGAAHQHIPRMFLPALAVQPAPPQTHHTRLPTTRNGSSMTSEIRFMTYQPKNPEAPTLAEIQSATLTLDGAFIDITAAFKRTNEAVEEAAGSARELYATYETSFSFTREYPATGREHRQVATRLARICRRPALIHNGGKPR